MPDIRTAVPAYVQRLSSQVFDCFSSAYRQQLVVAGRGGSAFRPELWWGRPDQSGVWRRAAKFLAQQSGPWPEYVGWLFRPEEDGRTRKLPEPSCLHSTTLWRKFESDYEAPSCQQALKRRLVVELHLQRSQLLAAAQEAMDAHDLGLKLYDGTQSGQLRRAILTAEITPLLACCIALQAGLTDVARRFRDAAWDQYWPYAALFDEIWGGLIPAQLTTEYTKVLRERKGDL